MSIPLLNTFCRLAATSANKVPRPSNHSLTTATGSKRSSADSDLLLCHIGLRRTSRLSFWQKYGCEHCEIKFALHNTHVTPHPPLSRSPFSRWRRLIVTSVSAGIRPTPAPLFQRACRQCVHESAQFFRAICSHAWYSKNCGERQNRRLSRCLFAACTCHAWLARQTRARRQWFGRRTARVLLADFWYFSSLKSTGKKSIFKVSSRETNGLPY